MKTRQVTKLFAVMAMAASTAAADPAPRATTAQVRVSARPVATRTPARPSFSMLRPRLMLSGGPASGNIMNRAGVRPHSVFNLGGDARPPARSVDVHTAAGGAGARPVAPVAVVPVEVRVLPMVSIELARPRTMPSGAPACGNVASRAPQPANCQPKEKP